MFPTDRWSCKCLTEVSVLQPPCSRGQRRRSKPQRLPSRQRLACLTFLLPAHQVLRHAARA